jgi:hypothetical protein
VTVAGDWTDFTRSLAAALAQLPDGALVVITERAPATAARYAQFAQRADGLTAEVVGDRFLPLPARLSEEGEEAVLAAGWREPEPTTGIENWWQRLSWPATADAYRELAGAVTVALRDGYGIPGPAALEYRAWLRDTGAPLDLALPIPATS